MTNLIERLEKEGGSRELDAALHVMFVGGGTWEVPNPDDMCAPGHVWLKSRGGDSLHASEKFTTSLDAATALCEQKTETREHFVEVFDKGVDLWIASGDEDHRTMPKYAVIALLRALEVDKDAEG